MLLTRSSVYYLIQPLSSLNEFKIRIGPSGKLMFCWSSTKYKKHHIHLLLLIKKHKSQSTRPLQCDQIGRFIALWATFQSLWQQLFCPKSPTFLVNFCKVVEIFHFARDIIFGQLLRTFGNFLQVTLPSPLPLNFVFCLNRKNKKIFHLRDIG